MREIAISKFKATCVEVLEEVRKTGTPVRITRSGRPMADVVPPQPVRKKSWLGCMTDSTEITGDLLMPTGAFDRWTMEKHVKDPAKGRQ